LKIKKVRRIANLLEYVSNKGRLCGDNIGGKIFGIGLARTSKLLYLRVGNDLK